MQVLPPENLSATADSSTSVVLTWVNQQVGHEGNKVEYKEAGAPSWTLHATEAANEDTSSISGLLANTNYEFRVTALNTAVTQVTRITLTEDAGAGAYDGKYIILGDDSGSVAFWIDVDNDGTAEPAHGADRSVEITTISSADSLATLDDLIRNAINGDGQFSAVVAGVGEIDVTNVSSGHIATEADSDITGSSMEVTIEGEDGDSTPTTSGVIYTWPGTVGFYWARHKESEIDDWTHIIEVSGVSPFLSGNSCAPSFVPGVPRFEDRISLSDYEFGPLITQPAY